MKKSKSEVLESILDGAGMNSLRARVDAHCVSCIYDDLVPGTWRQQVEDCSVTNCPLFEVRAKSRSTHAKSTSLELDGVLAPLEDVTPEMQRNGYISEPNNEDRGGSDE